MDMGEKFTELESRIKALEKSVGEDVKTDLDSVKSRLSLVEAAAAPKSGE